MKKTISIRTIFTMLKEIVGLLVFYLVVVNLTSLLIWLIAHISIWLTSLFITLPDQVDLIFAIAKYIWIVSNIIAAITAMTCVIRDILFEDEGIWWPCKIGFRVVLFYMFPILLYIKLFGEGGQKVTNPFVVYKPSAKPTAPQTYSTYKRPRPSKREIRRERYKKWRDNPHRPYFDGDMTHKMWVVAEMEKESEKLRGIKRNPNEPRYY